MCEIANVVVTQSDGVFIVCSPQKRWWVTIIIGITVLAHFGEVLNHVSSDNAHIVFRKPSFRNR